LAAIRRYVGLLTCHQDGQLNATTLTPNGFAIETATHNKSLDASGGSVFRIMTGPAKVA
jgi:hypothetical protein